VVDSKATRNSAVGVCCAVLLAVIEGVGVGIGIRGMMADDTNAIEGGILPTTTAARCLSRKSTSRALADAEESSQATRQRSEQPQVRHISSTTPVKRAEARWPGSV